MIERYIVEEILLVCGYNFELFEEGSELGSGFGGFGEESAKYSESSLVFDNLDPDNSFHLFGGFHINLLDVISFPK